MKRTKILITTVAIALGAGGVASLANAAAPAAAPAAAAPAPAPAPAPVRAPLPAPAPDLGTTGTLGPSEPGPGVFSMKKAGTKLHLVVTGHTFTNRDDVEKYLAYRAADETMKAKNTWFTFVEHRAKGDTVSVPKGDPMGERYSFRLQYFQPAWRYKLAGSPAWKTWSPFSGQPFFADGIDPKTITDFEVTADVVMHKGMVDDVAPLAFDGSALSDYLINQVEPPK